MFSSIAQWKFYAAGLIFGAAVLYLIYAATATSAVYYVTVGEFLRLRKGGIEKQKIEETAAHPQRC